MNAPVDNTKKVRQILTEELSTPGESVKSGCFKQSVYWANRFCENLDDADLKQVVSQALLERYREVDSYDQVTRNPGVFANDLLNTYLKSLDFPPESFYRLMKNPEKNAAAIKKIIDNTPDEVIDLYVKWYHEFSTRQDGDMAGKEPALKDKQFFALAAFGALTWRANEFEPDLKKAAALKKAITQFKNREDVPFSSFMDRLREKQQAYQEKLANGEVSNELPQSIRDQVESIRSTKIYQIESNEIQKKNDPYFHVINDMRYLNGFSNVQKEQMIELANKIDAQRSTGEVISQDVVKGVLEMLNSDIDEIMQKPELQKAQDAVFKFASNPSIKSSLSGQPFFEKIVPIMLERSLHNQQLLDNFDSMIQQLNNRMIKAETKEVKSKGFNSIVHSVKSLKETTADQKKAKIDVLIDIRAECQKMKDEGQAIDFDKACQNVKAARPDDYKVLEGKWSRGTQEFLQKMSKEAAEYNKENRPPKPMSG